MIWSVQFIGACMQHVPARIKCPPCSGTPSVRTHALIGQSLAEFAISLPILLLLIVGALDLGRVYFAQMTVTNAARVAARWGAAYPPRPCNGCTITCTGTCATGNP